MVNMKVMAGGLIMTFVLAILAGVFIPLIQSQFTALKATAPTASDNLSIDSAIQILYVLPVLIVVFGVVMSIIGGFVFKS